LIDVVLARKETYRTKFLPGRLSDSGLNLMRAFLTYNPDKRITANEALQHPYFGEAPHAKEPFMMPTWPARSDKKKTGGREGQIVQSEAQEDMERDREREKMHADRDKNYAGFRIASRK